MGAKAQPLFSRFSTSSPSGIHFNFLLRRLCIHSMCINIYIWGGGHAWFMLSGREPSDSGFLPSSKDTQQHSRAESSAAAPADDNKPGEASHKERERKREREYTEEQKKRGRMDRFRGSMEEKGVKNGVKRVKRKTEERLQQQCISYPHGPSSLATEQQGQAAKRVHPTITSPLNANQSGAPCNCVSHQPAITFKRSRVGSQRY